MEVNVFSTLFKMKPMALMKILKNQDRLMDIPIFCSSDQIEPMIPGERLPAETGTFASWLPAAEAAAP